MTQWPLLATHVIYSDGGKKQSYKKLFELNSSNFSENMKLTDHSKIIWKHGRCLTYRPAENSVWLYDCQLSLFNLFKSFSELLFLFFTISHYCLFQPSASTYIFRGGCRYARIYMHKSKQFYSSSLLSSYIMIKGNMHVTYSLIIKEIQNLNHKDRPCYEGTDYDDYVLKVLTS